MTHVGARKTKAERAAIDKRARAYPRPLSPAQHEALRAMAKGPLHHWRAGYGHGTGEQIFPSQTIVSLEMRGLCRIEFDSVRISPAGRSKLARLRR